MVGPKKRKEYEAELLKTAKVDLFDMEGKPAAPKKEEAAPKAEDKKADDKKDEPAKS